jgi:hypothetical protein
MTDTFKCAINFLRLLMSRSHTLWMAGLALAILVVACGGGETTASVGSGGTGAFSATAYSEGAITGLGSVTVNGKQYDDKLASVSDDNGTRTLADLKLGMIIRLSGQIASDGTATANTINIDSRLRGPVSLVNPIAKCFFIFGQRVQINDRTLFDGVQPDINAIQIGQVLEIHGYLNPVSNNIQASLIGLPLSASSAYKLSGLASNVDSTLLTMQIGQETFDLSAFPVGNLPTEGSFTQLTVSPTSPQGTTTGWVVSTLRSEYSNDTPQSQADIQGVVTEVSGSNTFRLNNTPVDATNAVLSNGSAIQVGDIVDVQGELINGRLIAQRVSLLWPPKAVELTGLVSNLNVVSYEPTFMIGGVLVYFDYATVYPNGAVSDLANGVKVDVQGVSPPFSADVRAGVITFLP